MSTSASNPFTHLVGCELPVQLAPMPGPVGTELAAAVAAAGGHAVYPGVLVEPAELERAIDRLRAATGAFGVNFVVPLIDRRCLELAASRAPLVDFFYGDPDRRLVEYVHAHGALASWQVGSLAEALAADAASCDLIVVQGSEAGGRIRGELGTLELVEAVAGRVEVPVLAAGGITTAGHVERALEAGADGVRIGTRFVASRESNAHPEWQQALVDAEAHESVVTRAFARGVPDFPHRVLRRSLDAAAALRQESVGIVRTADGWWRKLPSYSADPPTRAFEGHVEAMPFYAGTGVGEIRQVKPAGEIVAELAAPARASEALATVGGDR